jgi:hypothetical protein
MSGALVEDKMRRFKGECAHSSFKKCPIYTHDGASVKFSTNSHETDYSVDIKGPYDIPVLEGKLKAKISVKSLVLVVRIFS